MTQIVIIISDDVKLVEQINTTALTLTKLNKTIFVNNISTKDLSSPESDIPPNVTYILIDVDNNLNLLIDYIIETRKVPALSGIKIISLFSDSMPPDKNIIFNAGCDTIISKKEFSIIFNNILKF